MADTAFWSVELGGGMGPLVLGLPRNEILRILRDKWSGEIDREELGALYVVLWLFAGWLVSKSAAIAGMNRNQNS